ncbi:MAG: hypothetical protein MZW92_59855 [Comamonadaceae bacterium]|nr:hypothetical protein [Comamonadaceae bacterium]
MRQAARRRRAAGGVRRAAAGRVGHWRARVDRVLVVDCDEAHAGRARGARSGWTRARLRARHRPAGAARARAAPSPTR